VNAPGDTGQTAPVNNAEIADRLASLAQLMAAGKENPYKIKAYQRAAARIRTFSESLDELVREEADLTVFGGIGDAIASGRARDRPDRHARQVRTVARRSEPCNSRTSAAIRASIRSGCRESTKSSESSPSMPCAKSLNKATSTRPSASAWPSMSARGSQRPMAMQLFGCEGDGPSAKYFNTAAAALYLDQGSPRYVGGWLNNRQRSLVDTSNSAPDLSWSRTCVTSAG